MTASRRLAFLGPAGTYTEQAAIDYDPDAELVPYPSFSAIAAAVESGDTDEGIVAIENSIEGAVSATLDLLIHDTSLSIKHEVVLPIKHFLVGPAGAGLNNVEVAYSHPQALAQCRTFLAAKLPEVKLVASMSTAAAVHDMLEYGRGAAAIASTRAADLYGADVLAREIEDNPNNETRFVVLAVSDSPPTGNDKTSIWFSFDEDAPGILNSVLGEFSTRDINLAKIESRPNKKVLGQYIFLVDMDGHREDAVVNAALDGVRRQVSVLRVMGSYPRYRKPQE